MSNNADAAFVHRQAQFAANHIREMGELLGVPSSVRTVAQNACDGLSMLARRAGNILPWSQREIAVVGRYSSGKSSLINALLQQTDLLPSAMRPLTSLATFVRFGDGLPRVIMERDGSTHRIAMTNTRALMEGTAFHSQNNGNRKLFVCGNGSVPAATSEADIRAVELFTPSPLLKKIGALIDAPGWDSPEADTHKSHASRAEQVAESAHALIVVTTETGLHERDILLLQKHLFAPRTTGCPVAVVINKSDCLEREAAQIILIEARQRLREAFPLHAQHIALFVVSSLPAEKINAQTLSQLPELRAWITGSSRAAACSLDTQAMLHALLLHIQTFGKAVNVWQTGDFERSWEISSPEAMRFAHHLLEQAKTSMARFAAESVASELQSQVNLPGNGGGDARTDLRVWRKLRAFGFTSPEDAARTACLNTLNTIQKSLRSQFVTHCRQSQADSDFTILHPKISELLTESSVNPLFIPSAYDTDLDEWLRATGSHSHLSSHKAILSNRWASKTDTGRIAELRTLSGRLRDALTKAGQ